MPQCTPTQYNNKIEKKILAEKRKNINNCQLLGLLLVIPATQETEMESITVQG
jgi:hypothetical protein